MPLFSDVTTDAHKSTYELHLDLGSIQGESTSSTHSQEIEISSFSFGATNSAIRSAAGSPKGGKPTVSEITVSKQIDKASPALYSALVNSQKINTAEITMCKSTGVGKPEDYVTITLTNAYITSIQTSSSKDLPPNQKGAETVTINFQKIDFAYKIQLTSGLLAAGTSWQYDLTVGT
jgi:type VI secretion system secreted protein Hcp